MSFDEEEIHPHYSEVDLLSTHGRIGRKSYFVYSVIFPFTCFWVLASLAGVISKYGASFSFVANALAYSLLALAIILVSVIMIRLTILRCHDFNAKGWLAAFSVIPVANMIFALIPGNNGLNSYGDQPEPPSQFVKIGVVLITIVLVSLIFYTLYQARSIQYITSLISGFF